MRILGIDPGFGLVGWAIIDVEHKEISLIDCGVIETEPNSEHAGRLAEIYSDLGEILKKYSPERGAIETLIFNKNITTAMRVSEARGVITLALKQFGVPIKEFAPSQVKMAVTGYGNAKKKQVQESIKMICKLEQIPRPDDAADAVAVAIAAI